MKMQFARAALAAAALCFAAGAAVTVSAPAALAKDSDKSESPSVSRDVGVALLKAQKAMNGNDLQTAEQAVQEADAVKDKTDYDKFEINQFKAALAVQKKDYDTAAQAYEAMIASPSLATLSPENRAVTLKNGSALSFNAKHWPQVISDLEQLEKLKGLDSTLYARLATGYYLTENYAKAGEAAQKAVDMSTKQGQNPPEVALQVLLNAQNKNNDTAGVEHTQEQLALYYGWKDGWAQLIDRALGTKGMDELDALYLYRLRFIAGATSSGDDYSIAAGIASQKGYAAEAEAILNKGIASGAVSSGKVAGQLSQARSSARMDEHQLSSIAAAAERSKNGEQDIQLAEDYWGYGRYSDAVKAARRGMAKGHLRDPGEGNLILAASLIETGKPGEARTILQKMDGSAVRAQVAHLWDIYAQRKIMLASPAPAPAQAPAAAQSPPPAQN